jgi:hypothetical protein
MTAAPATMGHAPRETSGPAPMQPGDWPRGRSLWRHVAGPHAESGYWERINATWSLDAGDPACAGFLGGNAA